MALLVALVGAPDMYLESNRLLKLAKSGAAAEQIVTSNLEFLSWNTQGKSLPSDWQLLVSGAGVFLV